MAGTSAQKKENHSRNSENTCYSALFTRRTFGGFWNSHTALGVPLIDGLLTPWVWQELRGASKSLGWPRLSSEILGSLAGPRWLGGGGRQGVLPRKMSTWARGFPKTFSLPLAWGGLQRDARAQGPCRRRRPARLTRLRGRTIGFWSAWFQGFQHLVECFGGFQAFDDAVRPRHVSTPRLCNEGGVSHAQAPDRLLRAWALLVHSTHSFQPAHKNFVV